MYIKSILLAALIPIFSYSYAASEDERANLGNPNDPEHFYQDPRLYNQGSGTDTIYNSGSVYSFPTTEGLEEDNFAD